VLSRTYNGDCPNLSRKFIYTPELSKHLTTSICPWLDALMFVASMCEHCDVVKCLLSSGASMCEHCDVVKCLLSSGADVYLCDRNKQSPLFVASMSGHCDVVKCLRSY
jgi:ankyrin repeat protein